MNQTYRHNLMVRRGLVIAGLLAGSWSLAACATTPAANNPSATTTVVPGPSTNTPVLPIQANPIRNDAVQKGLTIDSVLVENNVDENGKAASDHLEVAIANGGATDLGGFEVFYTFTDPTTGIDEGYYLKLPDTFTVASGGQRVAHFDNSGLPDHFAVNEFSLYYTDTNALTVSVTVSAANVALQVATVQKDAGGPETAD